MLHRTGETKGKLEHENDGPPPTPQPLQPSSPQRRCWRRSGRTLVLLASVLIPLLAGASTARASEADLAIPDLHAGRFDLFGTSVTAWNLLLYGALVICGTLGISLYLKAQIRKLPAH